MSPIMSEYAITGVLVKDLPNFEQLNDRKSGADDEHFAS
jgi:hypothetical protein